MVQGKDKSMAKATKEKFWDLCTRVVQKEGFVLYDLEYSGGAKILRLFVMDESTDTASIDDCVKIDKALTPYLDLEEWIPDLLTLEVSSPGVYRVLRNRQHFERVLGEMIKIELSSKWVSETPSFLTNKRKLRARLLSVDDHQLMLECHGEAFGLDLSKIKKANLDSDIER